MKSYSLDAIKRKYEQREEGRPGDEVDFRNLLDDDGYYECSDGRWRQIKNMMVLVLWTKENWKPKPDLWIPPGVKQSIDDYVLHGVHSGSFVEAMMANDLMESFGWADESSRSAMFRITCYLYNSVPRGCRGSLDVVEEWRTAHAEISITAKSET